jgi:hypothetical protein
MERPASEAGSPFRLLGGQGGQGHDGYKRGGGCWSSRLCGSTYAVTCPRLSDGKVDMDDELSEFPEQWSDETRDALNASVEELIAALRAHAAHVAYLTGRSTEITSVFEVNGQVERAIDAWNQRAFDHTGTFPVSLNGLDEDGDQFDDEDDIDKPDELVTSPAVAVISRFDLVVTDTDELIAAGREAHKRNRPEEQDEDAVAAVPDVGQALYAVLHEQGEPWYRMPGVEVVRGVRAFVAPEEPAEPFSDEDADEVEPIVEPAGERLYLESWA